MLTAVEAVVGKVRVREGQEGRVGMRGKNSVHSDMSAASKTLI